MLQICENVWNIPWNWKKWIVYSLLKVTRPGRPIRICPQKLRLDVQKNLPSLCRTNTFRTRFQMAYDYRRWMQLNEEKIRIRNSFVHSLSETKQYILFWKLCTLQRWWLVVALEFMFRERKKSGINSAIQWLMSPS